MSVSEVQENKFSVLRWVARIWSIPAIFFAVNEILFPSTENGVQEGWFTWATVILMFLSIVGLLVAWWRDLLGGLASIGLLFLFFVFYWFDAGEFFPGWIWLVGFVALPAGLFVLYDYLENK
ncbi:MAG: hypothetical protein P8Y72_04000 [Anaerolineales bacterium]|jgi:hypothetical protein